MSESHILDYTEHFTIRAYEVDQHKQASALSLLRLMQEGAMQHVIQLGLSVWDLEPHQLAWVLVRQHLEIGRLPVLGETITVLTRPTGFERQFTYRDFLLYDAQGEIIAASSSTWLLMHTEHRTLEQIPGFVLDFKEEVARQAATPLPRTPIKLPKMTAVSGSRRFEVAWHDLDFNQHLNNVAYYRWMLESLPDEALQQGRLRELTVQFRAEAQWKDEVRAERQDLGQGQYLHRLVRMSDDKVLALGHSRMDGLADA